MGCAAARPVQPVPVMEVKKAPVLLLLGADDSGKKTILAQLRYYFKALSSQERANLTHSIRERTLHAYNRIVAHCSMVQPRDESQEWYKEVSGKLNLDEEAELTPQLAVTMQALWTGVRNMYPESPTAVKSLEYFVENGPRFASLGYSPRSVDMAGASSATLGAVAVEREQLTIGGQYCTVINFAPGPEAWPAWQATFRSVSSTLFVISLVSFVNADASANLRASLDLWRQVTENPDLYHCRIYLVFNKVDVFKAVLGAVPLQKAFPEFKGGDDRSAIKFIITKFRDVWRESRGASRDAAGRPHLKTFVTSAAVDANSVKSMALSVVEGAPDVLKLPSNRSIGLPPPFIG